jgi:release factor glutamine methyltransferase
MKNILRKLVNESIMNMNENIIKSTDKNRMNDIMNSMTNNITNSMTNNITNSMTNNIMKLSSKINRNEFKWMLQELFSNHSKIDQKQLKKLEYWINCRIKGKPLQYILGNQPFINLNIILRKPILIPRWETEEWTLNLIESIDKNAKLNILELCSGTGCISLALAKALPNSKIDACDISKAAIKLSRLNQRKLAIPETQLKFLNIDLFSNQVYQLNKYDLVVSNPPYIPPQEYEQLDKSVKDYEDKIALLAKDAKGVEFYERIVSLPLFKRGSKLVFEIGENQGEYVKDIMLNSGFINVAVSKDLAGQDRVVSGVYM